MNGGAEVASTNARAAGSRTTVGGVAMAMIRSPRRGLSGHGLAEPVLEAARRDVRLADGGERVVLEHRAEVLGAGVGHDVARVVVRPQEPLGPLGHAELLGACQ